MGNNMATQESGNPQPSHDPLQGLQELAREVTLYPLTANLIFESLSSAETTVHDVNEKEGENTHETALTQDGDLSQQESTDSPSQGGKGEEQFMRLEVQIPRGLGRHLTPKEHQCHVVVVADCSGSMAGNPWNQVKSALADIICTSLERSGIMVDVVVYSGDASQVSYTPHNYQSKMAALKSGGCTSFVAAMDKVDEVLKQRPGGTFNSTAVMFMTDGDDTVSTNTVIKERLQRWKTLLHALQRDVTVHAVGFNRNHNLQFLQELSSVGTRAGLFRYCEPGDGPEVLKTKVEELFDYAVYSSSPTVDVKAEMNGENRILGPGTVLQTHVIQGDVVCNEQTDTGDITVQAEMWVWVPDLTCLPAPVISLSKTVVTGGVSQVVTLPCVYGRVERKVLDDAASRVMWGLNILSRNTDVLATKIANAIRDKKDVSNLQSRMTRLQGRLSNTRIFGGGISKELRESLMESMKEIQAKMDTMYSMLARYSRGETASVSILARAHDLRYEAQFKKSRRQRMMDKRAVQNVQRAKADEAKLTYLSVNETEIAQISQEAEGFFFCTLSQESVVNILRDLENKENAIGFGMAVSRPEHIVDDPTSLRLCLVSGTLVSRSSMLDALDFKINLAGHLDAHNGFQFFHDARGNGNSSIGGGDGGSLGYATVGLAREPINAWLPLYVTPSHWERVKLILKPSLGYLCTLDPLGFDWRQMDVLFMILGAMIAQLSDTTVGLHQLQLLFAFQRTCVACVEDFKLTERMTTTVRDFLREPKCRFKHVMPNLYTLVGYIAALPVSTACCLLGYDEEGRDPSQLPTALWMAFLAEALRRAAGSLFRSCSDRQLDILVDLLLHGRNNSLMMPGKAQEATCIATETSNNTTGTVQEATCSSITITTATTSCEKALPSTDKTLADTSAALKAGTLPSTTSESELAGTVQVLESASTTEAAAAAATEVMTQVLESASTVKASASGPAAVEVAEQSLSSSSPHTSTTSAHFTILCGSLATQDVDLTIEGVQESQNSNAETSQAAAAAKPAVEFQHCAKMDSSMEIWARAELSSLQHKGQEKKVSSSKKQVIQWINEGRREAGLPDWDGTENKKEEEEDPLDCDAVDSSVLEVAAKLLTQLSGKSHLPLSSLPGAIAFLHTWLSTEHSFAQMSDGLPPAQWIEEVKDTVARVYSAMHDYVAQCRQQVSHDDLEEVVIVEGGGNEVAGASRSRQGGGKGGRRGNRGDNDDDDDDDEVYSDDEDYGLDEDDPMKVLRRRQQEHHSLVTLPMILHILDPCENKTKVTRAMLCQAVIHCTNLRAKEAASSGQFLDLKNKESVEGTLRSLHSHLVKVSAVDNSYSILWQRANAYLLHASNIFAFLGYLMNTYKDRDEGFSWLLTEIARLSEGSRIPCLADKVKVMLTGRWEDHHVVSRGNSCIPGKDVAKKLEKVLGEEAWSEIDLQLRGNLRIHVYRESDIPNRHGHCNSNPYIPPALRLKLGLPPL